MATVRHVASGTRVINSSRWALSRRPATGAATSSGTRRADSTGVTAAEAPWAAGRAGAFSAWTMTDTPETVPITSNSGTTYHARRARSGNVRRDCGAGD